MKPWEKAFIKKEIFPKIKEAHAIARSKHCKERMKERGIEFTAQDFVEAMTFENLIEVNNNEGKPALLFRSTKVLHGTQKGNANVVFVVGYNFKVVSAWLNNVNDKHDTLDMEQYNPEVPVNKIWTGWMK